MNRSQRAIELMREFSKDSQRRSILDLGCGYGETLKQLVSEGYEHLTGLEYDTATFASTSRDLSGSSVILVQEAGESTSFPSNSFHVVLSLDVLEHVASDEQVVKEIARVLKSDGIFIGSVPYRGASFLLDPENILSLLRRKRPAHHHYTIRELTKLLEPYFTNISFERRGIGLSQLVFLTTYLLRPFFKSQIERFQLAVSHWEFARLFGSLSYHVVFTGEVRSRD